jgi:hypothetical protein
MNVWLIVGLAVAAVILLLALLAMLPQKPHKLTKDEVADEIEAFLEGRGGTGDWDDFCTFTIADPELDRIRARCARLGEEFPPHAWMGGYCNEEGLKVLQEYVVYLRGSGS